MAARMDAMISLMYFLLVFVLLAPFGDDSPARRTV